MNYTTAGIMVAAIAGAGLIAFMLMGNTQPQPAMENSDATTTTRTNDSTMGQNDTMEREETADMPESPQANIVETAQNAGSFNILLQAAQATGLAEALATQEVTVFAPTDAAFEALPEGTLEDLLNNPDQLAEVLKYHVVPGRVTAAQVVELNSAQTLQGSDVTISTENNSVMVDDAEVVQTDIMASNGVIHVIDQVITP